MSASNGVVVARTMANEVEVLAKATWRRFSAEYKVRILREAEACTRPGEIGALLRREGLYSSNLTTWRSQRERGELPSRRTVEFAPEIQQLGSGAFTWMLVGRLLAVSIKRLQSRVVPV